MVNDILSGCWVYYRMSLSTKYGQFAAPLANGNSAVSGLGFQPKLVFFFTQLSTANDTYLGVTGAIGSFGMTDGTTQVAFGGNHGTTNPASTSFCLTFSNFTTSTRAAITSLDADGFTLNWSGTSAADLVGYFAIGGADLTNVKIVSKTLPAAVGAQAITGVGFKPDCVFNIGHFSNNVDTKLSWGGASSLTHRGYQSYTRDSSSVQKAFTSTTNFIGGIDNSAGTIIQYLEGDIQSFDSDGFTVNWTTVTSAETNTYYALCLKGASFYVGSIAQPGANGNQAITGLGFSPKGILALSNSQYGAGVTTGYGNTIAAASSSSAYGMRNIQSNIGTGTLSTGFTSNTSFLRFISAVTPTINSDCTVSSFDSDGFTLNWSATDANARNTFYLAFGNSPPSGGKTITGISTIQGISTIL